MIKILKFFLNMINITSNIITCVMCKINHPVQYDSCSSISFHHKVLIIFIYFKYFIF